MRLKFGVALLFAVSLVPAIAQAQTPVGRWEIVHTSGDNSTQTNLYPGGFSTYLYADGTGDTYGTSSNSICLIDETSSSVVPSWINLGANTYQITMSVNNFGLGPNFSFVYTGTYSATTPVPGDSSLQIPAISGTYYPVGDASACSTATEASPGNFVATFLPDLSSGSSSGSLDGTDTDGGSPFDSSVTATINYSTPPVLGQIAGTVSLNANPTLSGNACFATTAGLPNSLTIDSSLSTQAGLLDSIYAEGFDPQGDPTTLVLQGFSANLYITTDNTDPTAGQIATTEWAAGAAIGEDDPDLDGTQGIGTTGVSNDGTNNAMVQYYNVIGGACDGAGGSDAPFHFLSGKPLHHRDKKHRRRHNPSPKGKAREKAADVMKVSPRSVQDAKRLKQEGPEKLDAGKRGEIKSLNAAMKEIVPPEPAPPLQSSTTPPGVARKQSLTFITMDFDA